MPRLMSVNQGPDFPGRSLIQAKKAGIAPWDDVYAELADAWVFRDRFPVTRGHLLFVPKWDTPADIVKAVALAIDTGDAMVARGECDAYNIGINRGEAAGQTVMYPHVHLIPRRSGDTPDPVGGVRGVIPGQANYRLSIYREPCTRINSSI